MTLFESMELMSNPPINFNIHNDGSPAVLAESMHPGYSEEAAFNPLHIFPPGCDASVTASSAGAVAGAPHARNFQAKDCLSASLSDASPSESMLITTPLMSKLFPTEEAPDDPTSDNTNNSEQDGNVTMAAIVQFFHSGISKNGMGSETSKIRCGERKRTALPSKEVSCTKKAKKSTRETNQMGSSEPSSPSLLGRRADDISSLSAQNVDTEVKSAKKYQYRQVVASKIPSNSNDLDSSPCQGPGSQSPQCRLNEILTSRGYSTKTYTSFECGYYSQSSPLQRASYGTAVFRAVQRSDVASLAALLRSGLSRNPCNAHGDSTMHLVCKRGDHGLFQCLVESGASILVADQFGRTPLHHAAWASETDFRTVELMLEKVGGKDGDVRDGAAMFRITDKNGKAPLEYLTRNKWAKWIDFLESKKDVYFPESISKSDEDPLSAAGRCSGSESVLADPDDALPVDIATLVASGQMEPKDARKKVESSDLEEGS